MNRSTPVWARTFIACIGERASARAMSIVTGVSERQIRRMVNYSVRRSSLSLEELTELYIQWKAERKMSPCPRLQGAPGSAWTEQQLVHLLTEYGRYSLSTIAAELGRTRMACFHMLGRHKAQVAQHHAWRLEQLAHAIKRPPAWVKDKIEIGLLRSYTDRGVLYIHRDDAEYMVHYWHGRNRFPRHPGKYETDE